MKNLAQKSSEEIFSAIVQQLSSATLKEFVSEKAKHDVAFLHQFILRFIEDSSIPSEEKFTVLVKSIVQSSLLNTKFNSDASLEQLTERASMMVGATDFLDAFYISTAIISNYTSVEIKSQIFQKPLEDAISILSTVMNSEAGYDLKEKVFSFLTEDALHYSMHFTHSLRAHWLNAVVAATLEEEQLQVVLNMLPRLKEKMFSHEGESSDEIDEELLLTVKWKILEKMGRGKEAHRLVQSSIRFKFFRLKMIAKYLSERQHDEAKKLIKEGKQLEESSGRLLVSTEWDELLFEIAEKESDKKMIRNLALQLFLSSDYDFKYYFLLKQQYEPAKWKQQIDRLIQFIRKDSSFYNKGIHATAKIYTLEEEWEKLLLLLQKNTNLDFVEEHAHKLGEKYPYQLLEVYRKAIRRFAEKYMGTEAYRRITNAIYKMLVIKDGKEVVQPMLAELKVDYRGRKAFVDALRKIVL